jgi:hypothetical protein
MCEETSSNFIIEGQRVTDNFRERESEKAGRQKYVEV